MIPNPDTDLTSVLNQKLPLQFRRHLLFLSDKDWEEPLEFCSLSNKDRKKVFEIRKPKSTYPTPSNQWVWFGGYAKPHNKPIYHNQRVNRYLYETLIGKLGEARLTCAYTTCFSDVNPYKYFPHRQIPLGDPIAALKAVEKVVKNKQASDKALDRAFTAMENDFVEYGYHDLCNGDAQEIFKMMLGIGHAPVPLREFLRRRGYKL